MKLTLEDLKKITFGALEINEENGRFSFERFTKEQREYYSRVRPDFMKKVGSTASVMMDFYTDSSELSFIYESEVGSGASYCFFDVYVDGCLTLHEGSDGNSRVSGGASLALAEGKKRIQIYLPLLERGYISELTLKDGGYRQVNKTKKALIYGDSITQGYYAHYPSLSYANIIARELELDAINQGIGAEHFNPGMVGTTPICDPALITVAYGTNDWHHESFTREEVEAHARDFFLNLRALYPKARIVYITPIWRRDYMTDTSVGGFLEISKVYADYARAAEIDVVDGMTLTAHFGGLFTDGLHPNDLGFTQFASALMKHL